MIFDLPDSFSSSDLVKIANKANIRGREKYPILVSFVSTNDYWEKDKRLFLIWKIIWNVVNWKDKKGCILFI